MNRKDLIGTMNQLANSKNAFQGTAKKVLTVCSAGLLRSPTTAKVLGEKYGYNTRAAGIVQEYALIPVTEALIYWADEIVFMNGENLHEYKRIWKDSKLAMKMIEDDDFQVLNIPDNLGWGDEQLIKLILDAYDES